MYFLSYSEYLQDDGSQYETLDELQARNFGKIPVVCELENFIPLEE